MSDSKQARRRMQRLVAMRLWGGLLGLMCGGTSLLVMEEISCGIWSTFWPQVDGTVVMRSTKMETRSSGRRSGKVYVPLVEYAYRVGETDYVGRRYSFSPVSSREEAQMQRTIATQVPVNNTRIAYNPVWPSISVLVPGLGGQRGRMLLLNLSAAIVSLSIAGYAHLRMRSVGQEHGVEEDDLARETFAIDCAESKNAELAPRDSMPTIEAKGSADAIINYSTECAAAANSAPYWARVIRRRPDGSPDKVWPIFVDQPLIQQATSWMAQGPEPLVIGSRQIDVESGPVAMTGRIRIASEDVWRERAIELTQPQPDRMVIGMHSSYKAVLVFLAICCLVIFVVLIYALGAGGILFSLILSTPALILFLWHYLNVPQWHFCRATNRVYYKRFRSQFELPLRSIVGVQYCCGGLKVYPPFGTDKHTYQSPSALKPCYQVNLVLDHSDTVRLPLITQYDSDWTLGAARRLAEFLAVPLINACPKFGISGTPTRFAGAPVPTT